MSAIRIEIQGQSFDAPLPEAAVRIGKNADADLCVQGEGMGGEHCVLEPLGGGRTKVKDLGSGYETLVNGVAIKQISLSDGDVIQVGEAKITYLATAAGVVDEPEAIPEAAPPPPASKPRAPKAPAAATPPATQGKAKTKDGVPLPPPPPSDDAPAAPTKADESTVDGTKAEPSADEGPRRDTSDAPRSERAASSTSRVPMVGILAGVIILVGVFLAVGAMDTSEDTSLAGELAAAERLYDDQDFPAARAKFRVVLDGAPEGSDLKLRAKQGLVLVGEVEREMDGRLERLQSERLDLTAELFAAERRRFLDTYGDAQAPRFDAAKASMLRAQSQWKQQNLDATAAVAEGHVEAIEFGKARAAWETLGAKSPAGIDVTAEVAEALTALEMTASAKADELIERAEGWNKARTAFRSVKLFEDMLPRFAGFEAEARLKAAHKIALAEREKAAAYEPPPTQPGPTQPGPTRPPVGPDDPTPTKPPVDVSAEAAAKKRADVVLASALVEVDARRFREAAAKLSKDARGFAPGTQRVRLEAIASDFGGAARAKDLIIADIKARPESYTGVRIAARLKVALVDADGQYLHAKVSGGHSKHAWARLPSDAWVRLVGRLRPGKDAAMPAAALLHVLARDTEAERMLATAVEQGVSTDIVFPTLARWRSMEVPEGGFVLHEGRYVTPAEREHALREARIAAALTKLDSRDADEREAAAKELLEIGEPAAQRFREALQSRRAYLLDEIVRSKSYMSGKYKSKLLQLLAERRQHALALIYDAQAYPYPNPQKRNQKEVEERVDKVREVWERPFDLVSQWDKKLQERMNGLTEVDSLLSHVDPEYQPTLDELKERINKAIDVPGSADPGKREYSLKVIVYNTTLKTTAGTEEKANTRSVNNYRMMMGLLAVKIDEKLVRGARGHSRHMATNGYFAHDVPAPYATPTNRTPGIRAKQQGFGGGVGENIARGPGTGHGAFMAWFRSSGHHRNMLGRGWLVMGCGRANQTWWTQLFGGGSKSLKAPDPLPPPAAPFAPDPADKQKPQGGADDAE